MGDPPSAPIAVVVFDAVGTLIFPDPPAGVVYCHAAKRFGLRLDENAVTRRLSHAIRAEFGEEGGKRLETDESVERQCWRRVVQQVFPELEDAGTDLFESLWSHFAQPSHWRVNEDAQQVWSDLDQHDLRLAIASNFDERLESICRELHPLPLAAGVFHSARMGYRKPSRAFFDSVAGQLKAEPGTLLMVGDSPVADYQGASQAGWQAVLLGASPKVNAAHRIARLRDLLPWLAERGAWGVKR